MNEVAPEGYIWVCCVCGKRSRDNYGNDPIDHGWDESCILNCVLAKEADLEIIKIDSMDNQKFFRVAGIDGPIYKSLEEFNNDS